MVSRFLFKYLLSIAKLRLSRTLTPALSLKGEGVKAPSPLAGEGWDEGEYIQLAHPNYCFTQKHLENPQLVPTSLLP